MRLRAAGTGSDLIAPVTALIANRVSRDPMAARLDKGTHVLHGEQL
jgi:hypothetical protein